MKLCLIVNKGEKAMSFDIKGDAVSIGRSDENDIQIHDKYVSRHHLIVWKKGSRFFLKNLGSRNGTKVGGNRVPSGGTVEVKRGDAIAVGLSVFCIGEGSTGDMFAFLQSYDFGEDGSTNTSTVLLEDTIYDFL
jgi:pSer/pThr/pTyr-binding forkhead associated (FHA) protein